MIKKITALIAAAACTGLIAFIAPGFAREIASVALPSGKLHARIDNGILATRPRIQGAQRIPGHRDVIGAHRAEQKLPRGCTNRHQRRAVTTISSKGFASEDEL